ncbi:hypothetical protein B296_00001453 [Ensete ventricosum]|uniref:Uncharacterized protein n=1 Tax=Ensete ventricosum TaxID=4639 RepID=A0A427B4T7_ENSVE|nr:hypothetical protein B296_00001453 [Ensete ventricosum]
MDASGQTWHSASHTASLFQQDAPPLASSQRPQMVASPERPSPAAAGSFIAGGGCSSSAATGSSPIAAGYFIAGGGCSSPAAAGSSLVA